MKKFLLVLFLFLISSNRAFGAAGYTDVAAAKVNIQSTNGVNDYRGVNALSGYSGTKSNTSYFHLKAAEAWIYKNNGSDVTGIVFYYRIYKSGSTPPSFSSISLSWVEENGSGTIYQKWGNYAFDVDLLSGVNSPGEWKFECYYQANTNGVDCANPIYLNSGGDNYSFTFTADNSLPVELTSFSGKVVNGKVNLNWNTATEINNYGFEVERAKAVSGSQNVQFAKVGFVEGNGNSNSPKSYSFTDANVTEGKYIYRLKQIDTDGQFEYSQEVEVSVENLINGYVLEQNYPNPFNPSTSIKFGFQNDTRAEVKVYNVIGAEVATLFNGMADAGRIYEVTFDASGLASGTYFYKLVTPDKTDFRKMILMK
ncbi:MAG: hypothetical protein FMNOHCHN_00631 [Ignavibacteriaceae bacterium]|nr:hypothetical protein [Ignavibacteriaceae bacterium]